MIFIWAQELLCCYYTAIHIPDMIMAGVDALANHFGPLIDKNLAISTMLRDK